MKDALQSQTIKEQAVSLYTDHDLRAAAALLGRAFGPVAETFGLTPENCKGNGAFTDFGRLKSEVAGGLDLWGIWQGETLVACGGFVLKKQWVVIQRLAVDPDFQGKGLGRVLMEALEDLSRSHVAAGWAQGWKVGLIAENHPLIRFYQGCGYRHLSTKTFSHLPHGVVFMGKRPRGD